MQFSCFNPHINNLLPPNIGFLKNNGKCFKCKIPKLISRSSFFFILKTQNNLKGPFAHRCVCVIARVGQVRTLATYKDTGITNSCLWKLHNTSPTPLPGTASSVPVPPDLTATRNKYGLSALNGTKTRKVTTCKVESGQLFSKPFRQSKASTPFRPY